MGGRLPPLRGGTLGRRVPPRRGGVSDPLTGTPLRGEGYGQETREGNLQKSDRGRLPRPWRDGFAYVNPSPAGGEALGIA